MGGNKFLDVCINLVKNHYHPGELSKDDIYVVWGCKTLQNNKALLSTNKFDGLYFEITYNGDKEEAYVDVYSKTKNYAVKVS